MQEKVLATIQKFQLLHPGQRVVVALSGGADSMALLHILLSLREEYDLCLSAAHVNHRLRGEESDRDEVFVREECRRLGIPMEVLTADLPALSAEKKLGIEECARMVRYDFLERLTASGGVAATAHHLNDQLETVLFHLARGTGLAGLCGIPPKRGNIIRPLLGCTRQEIEEYCTGNGISYVVDSSNLSDDYTRNYIRHHIVPQFEALNPAFPTVVGRMTENLSQIQRYLAEQLEPLRDVADRETLLAMPDLLRRLHLRRMVEEGFQRIPEQKHIDGMEETLKTGKQTQICGGIFVSLWGNLLHLSRQLPCPPPSWEGELTDTFQAFPPAEIRGFAQSVSLEGDGKVHKNLSIDLLDCAKIIGKVRARNRRPGDRFRPVGRGCTKNLKQLFQESAIPPLEREERIVLADDVGVIWVEGFGCAERVAPGRETPKLYQLEIRKR